MTLFWIFLAFFPFYVEAALKDVKVQAASAILINRETGAILYEKNPHRPLYPASITKIATVAYALKERGDKWEKLIAAEQSSVASVSQLEMERSNYTLPAHWLTHGAQHIGIKRGEQLSLKDLCYGTMLASGGDAANVIADYIGGTIPTFMQLLNAHIKSLGCLNTEFKNPHGLHHPKHVTTAYDMALIAKDAMSDARFREIVRTVNYKRPQTNKQTATTLVQTNQLLKKGKHYYSKATGIKTGYTAKAHNTLVASAKQGDRELIAVLIKCKKRDDMFADAKKLFEEAFKEKKIDKIVFQKGIQKFVYVIQGSSKSIPVYIQNDVLTSYYPTEIPEVNYSLLWNQVSLPIKKGDPLGTLSFKDSAGNVLAMESIFAAQDVEKNSFEKIKDRLQGLGWFKWTLFVFIPLILFLFARR